MYNWIERIEQNDDLPGTQMYSRESSTQALRPFSFSLLAGSQHVNSSHIVSYSQFDEGEPYCSYFTGVVVQVCLFFLV